MAEPSTLTAVVHADESCLGNGQEGANPGGAASLVEIELGGRVHRMDLFISAADTTNNRMALSGAIATLALLLEEHENLSVVYFSDSQYLIKGLNEWVPAWRARGWRRKGGQVENLELWKRLDKLRGRLDGSSSWHWLRGHAGHAKNEYVNDLAVEAAREQKISDGLIDSRFLSWLGRKQSLGMFLDFDPDRLAIGIDTAAR